MQYQSVLQEIYLKLQKLLKEHEHLKKENFRLQKQLEQKSRAEKEGSEELQLLKDQLAILNTSGHNASDSGKKELEKRINQYLRDIEKTIALLNE